MTCKQFTQLWKPCTCTCINHSVIGMQIKAWLYIHQVRIAYTNIHIQNLCKWKKNRNTYFEQMVWLYKSVYFGYHRIEAMLTRIYFQLTCCLPHTHAWTTCNYISKTRKHSLSSNLRQFNGQKIKEYQRIVQIFIMTP